MLLIEHEDPGCPEPGNVPSAASRTVPDEIQTEQQHELQSADERTVEITEENRRGLHAKLQIVGSIRHCVLGVVDHDPDHRDNEQQPTEAGNLAEVSRKCHRHAPGECDTEHELRRRYESLGKRIDECQQRADDR